MFSGGVVMKKYKLSIMGAAKFAFGTSLLGYFLSLFFLAMGCENSKVAGITVAYTGYVCHVLVESAEEESTYRQLIIAADAFPMVPSGLLFVPLF